jgi:hypothetical protein
LPAKSSNGLADGRANPQRGLLNHLPKNIYNLYIYLSAANPLKGNF